MERKHPIRPRQFRSKAKAAILDLLKAHHKSWQSVQAFCVDHNIATGNFHRWKKQYSLEAIVFREEVTG